jgi:hypothetical protein
VRWCVCAVGVAAAVVTLAGFQLGPSTLSAFERYIKLTEDRIATDTRGAGLSLWLDRQPPSDRPKIMARLRLGEVVVASMETRDGGRKIEVDGGLIHHWVGTVLMPGVTIDRVVAFVQDYDRYPQVFAPMIQRARILQHEQDRYVVSMRTYVKKVISVVMDGDYIVDYHRIGPTRISTTNVATNLYQVEDAGTASERREPGDVASGYLWRFRMYCVFEERPEGSIEQCESVSLSRGVPFGLSWIVKPFVTSVPRETLAFTLGKVRAGLVR